MCSNTSPRFLAASTISSSRSRTFTWPVNSLNAGGRSEISKAVSDSGGFIGDGVLEGWSNGVTNENFSILHHSVTPAFSSVPTLCHGAYGHNPPGQTRSESSEGRARLV